MNVKDILENLGYKLTEYGQYYRTNAIYRDGDNRTSLSVHKNKGYWRDFVTGETGNLTKLIELTLKTPYEEAKKWLSNRDFRMDVKPMKKEIKIQKKYPEDILLRLLPIFSFYEQRGISKETLITFKCGLATNGQLLNRIVFPIYNENKEIIGFDGRTVLKENNIKWKKIGRKSEWVYPWVLAEPEIKNKLEVILVESIGDCLALWEADVRNVLVLFGVSISNKLINYLIKTNPNRIYISTNNDASGVGNKAAEKIKNKLNKFFDNTRLIVRLPTKKDFGEMSAEEIKTFWE